MAEYIWPWPRDTRSSQEFGTNPGGVNPVGGHTGLDAPLPVGTPLRAEADGIVTFEGWANLNNNPYLLTDGGGICLVIDFGDGKPLSVKGHLSTTFVSVGDRVKQGQIVAESGNTGKWTTGPHVHEEFMPPVYFLNSPTYGRVNPRDYCTAYWEDLISIVPAGDITTALKPFQRMTATKVWERSAPTNETDTTRIKLWDEETIFDMGGYVTGADALGDGNRIWFKGRYSEVYFHSSAFTDMDIHDLPNLTPAGTVPQPAPAPAPEVVVALHGADISMHQGDIDLAQIGGDFIGIKATEGDGYLDPKFERNEELTRADSRVRIFYHFARPDLGNTAAAELAWFLSTVGPRLRLGDVLALDWEAEKADLGDVGWADRFLTGAQDTHGGTPVLYAGNAAISAAGDRWEPVETRFPLWYPSYGADNPIDGYHPEHAGARPPVVWGGKPMLIWQYTRKGKQPGYAGDLDQNAFYGTREELAALGVTRLPAAAVQPPPAPAPDLQPPPPDAPITELIAYYTSRIDGSH